MCLFIETIRIEHGQTCNLCYHERRLNETRRHLFGIHTPIHLAEYLHPSPDMDGTITRCRIVYGEKGIIEITYSPYILRTVRSLRMVHSDEIDYTYKSANRGDINRLFDLRKEQDDILIVKNGLLTDTSIANIALYDGSEWYTPLYPLLKGTQRESLIDRGILKEADISPEMIKSFSHIRMFNAMINWGAQELPTSAIQPPTIS